LVLFVLHPLQHPSIALYIKEKSAKIIGKNISLFWTFHFPAHKRKDLCLLEKGFA